MASNQKLISFDLKAEMGFFKKPDINSGVCLTYNMLHKPALLGILGAIAGLQGYQKNGELPDYYRQLNHLRVGIMPLGSNNGNFQKDIITYNNGTGFASSESGGNLMVTEQMILKPSYRCYLLLNLDVSEEKTLYDRIWKKEAEFLPYMGKNDFSAWWDNVVEYSQFAEFDFDRDYKISTIFAKDNAVSGYEKKMTSMFSDSATEIKFLYFEKLPVSFDEKLLQYEYKDFVYSNFPFRKDMVLEGLYRLDNKEIIQLF
jgi:CRISPR-associated protein Cas5h